MLRLLALLSGNIEYTWTYLDWLHTQEWTSRHKDARVDSWLMDVPELYSRRAPGNTCLAALHSLDAGKEARNNSCGYGGVMRTAHFSRNPKIASFMKEYEFIREFDEGVDRMYRELEEGGWPKPMFKQDDFMLRASLSSRFAPKTSPKTSPETSPETPVVNLSERELSILALIRKQRNITTQEMADILGISKRAVIPYLKSLQGKRIILREGPKKGGWWNILVDKAE